MKPMSHELRKRIGEVYEEGPLSMLRSQSGSESERGL